MEKKISFRMVFLLAAVLSAGVSCEAGEKTGGFIDTKGLSYDEVKQAISDARPGDTVSLPEGEAMWNKPMVIDKGIKIVGAGAGKTVIYSGFSAPDRSNVFDTGDYLVIFRPSNPSTSDVFRLSGMTLDLKGKSYGILLQNKTVTAISQLRIDNNVIKDPAGNGNGILIHIYGTLYGVVDNNELVNGSIRCNGLDTLTWNNWDFDFGTAENMYFEDNRFKSPDAMYFYGEMGGRYCARYNTFDGTGSDNGLYPFSDMHGNMPSSGHNATMGVELYNNTITCNKGVCLMDQRGGKALIYNNTVETPSDASSKTREEYLDSLNPPTVSPVSGQPQHVSSSYYWNNVHGSSGRVEVYVNGTVNYGGDTGVVPRENRDFWAQGSSFNGTAGIGVGTFSERPATCTKGVGYWATDEKVLYIATATNVWTRSYTPYTYPHPLRSSMP